MGQMQTAGTFAKYRDGHPAFLRRLAAVQQAVHDAITSAPAGPVFVIDICGGEGHGLLPVVAAHPRRADVGAAIVELDPASVASARTRLTTLALPGVRVIAADAGLSESYQGLPRAQVVILSGVFAHLSPADRLRFVRFLPQISAPGATFIWTIGNRVDPTRIRRVRAAVAAGGVETSRLESIPVRPGARRVVHEVGVGRVSRATDPLQSGVRVFTFRRSSEKRHPRVRAVVRWLRRQTL